MLREWIKAIWIFYKKGNKVFHVDVNGDDYSKRSIYTFYAFFFIIASILFFSFPKGFCDELIEYAGTIYSIFVGFFITILVFASDKLIIKTIKNPNAIDELRQKQLYHYKKRFFYAIGLNVFYSLLTLILLMISFSDTPLLDANIFEYYFLHYSLWTYSALMLFLKLSVLCLYRFAILYMTLNVFAFSIYSISSLLQVVITHNKGQN